jgi:ATP/maltotriose-dependent transcriptional regulator MalT
MVHRAEVMRLRGDWKRALEETVRAGERFLEPPPHPAAGAAFYQEGEVHRLAGRFEAAEAAYVRAATLGRNPQPGMALLRLAQGRVESAEPSIRRELREARDPMARAGILPAYVEITIAAGAVEDARLAAAELTEIAASAGSAYLLAAAAQATGATLLADGDAEAALVELRRAAGAWRELEAALQTAEVRLLIGLACRDLGDEDTATLEIEGAREAFRQLGAIPDLRRVDMLTAGTGERVGGLTGREVEVLALLATGTTNRQIAARLVISEKTVARHVSNIFNKLGVSSRAAATAHAFKHDLV